MRSLFFLLILSNVCYVFLLLFCTGSSFITDNFGAKLQCADRTSESIIVADLHLTSYAKQRAEWGLFRDRRPELYGALLTKDGCK